MITKEEIEWIKNAPYVRVASEDNGYYMITVGGKNDTRTVIHCSQRLMLEYINARCSE